MEMPFNIGDTYYLPHHNPRQISVPCPICYGNKKVTLVLGNEDQVEVECDGCGLGYEGPRGYIMSYTYEPFVSKFTIAGVHSMYQEEWTVKSTGGETANMKQLYTRQSEALLEAQRCMAECIEHNMRSNASAHMRKKLAWAVRYHEEQIKEYERKIAWHRSKVSERKTK